MPIRYIVQCLRCNGIFFTGRRDAFLCSGACRVWLHRHPERREQLERIAYEVEVDYLPVLARVLAERWLERDATPAERAHAERRLRGG